MVLNAHLVSLAHLIYDQSLDLESGDLILLEGMDLNQEVLLAFAEIGKTKGYSVYIMNKFLDVNNFNNMVSNLIDEVASFELKLMKQAKALIGLRNVVEEKFKLNKTQKSYVLDKYIKPVHYAYRNNHLQWVYFRLPNQFFAKQLGQPIQVFEDYYYQCTLLNYDALKEQHKPLIQTISQTKGVKIIGGNTHLEFDLIEDGVFNSAGFHNLPDGEIFTSPLKYSVNGTIEFNVPSTYYGVKFD